MRLVLALALACSLNASHAAGVTQRVGERLPLDVRLTDAQGRETTLAKQSGGVPAIVVFGYYRCPTLCTTLMESVLVAASASGLAPDAYRIVEIGIDPRESARDASAKAELYRNAYGPLPLELLTGRESDTRRIASAAGVEYAYDERFGQYSHPLGFIVATPGGTISRYFPGVGFDAKDVKLALIEASDGRTGSLADRIFLRCAHYDEATGRYSLAAMSAVRAISLALAAALGVWIWSRRGA